MNRLERIKNYAKKAKENEKEEDLERKRIAEALVSKILALEDRIQQVLETANACVNNGISVDVCDHRKYKYENGGFKAEHIHHRVGFWEDLSPIKYIGIRNGEDGDMDFRTNGKVVEAMYNEQVAIYNIPRIEDMTKFLNDFDHFEKSFYTYVDKKLERMGV